MPEPTTLLPLSLLFVGAVLVLNGLWMLGQIADREVATINFVTVAISGVVAFLGVVYATDVADVRESAMTLLFTVTYLWVGLNCLTGADGRGLGWFSLFVSLSVVPEAVRALGTSPSMIGLWLSLSWAVCSAPWFLFFLTLALRNPRNATQRSRPLPEVFSLRG